MTLDILGVLAAVLYLAATALVVRRIRAVVHGTVSRADPLVPAAVATAAAFHAAVLYRTASGFGRPDLDLTGAASLVAWAIVVLYLVVSVARRVENLGVVIFPLAALAVLAGRLGPQSANPPPGGGLALHAHLVIAILAYALLSLAVLQALQLALLDHELRHRRRPWLLHALPPMESMEALLFQLIGLGFALLTLTLVTGIFFSEQLFGQAMVWSHHIVLSVIAWAVFGGLLLGRWRFGWRGRHAVRWTVGGFVLLVLAYFGTKFVLEVILGR